MIFDFISINDIVFVVDKQYIAALLLIYTSRSGTTSSANVREKVLKSTSGSSSSSSSNRRSQIGLRVQQEHTRRAIPIGVSGPYRDVFV